MRALFLEAGLLDVAVEPLTVSLEDYTLANQVLALEGTVTRAQEGGLVSAAEAVERFGDRVFHHMERPEQVRLPDTARSAAARLRSALRSRKVPYWTSSVYLKTFVKQIAAGGTTGQPGVRATLHA